MNNTLQLFFRNGYIFIDNIKESSLFFSLEYLTFSNKESHYYCLAYFYRRLVKFLRGKKIVFQENNFGYQKTNFFFQQNIIPYHYQTTALQTWENNGGRGIIVMPTGSGKSILAAMSIVRIQRTSLILVPTLDLLNQWQKNLQELFQISVGTIGGGDFLIECITVCTYDSARIHSKKLGHYFYCLIFDECHHINTENYFRMASHFIAPYRLGLTATPNQDEDRTHLIEDVIGSIIYTKDIIELSGTYLADYELQTVYVELTAEEKKNYLYHREFYRYYKNQLRQQHNLDKWESFIFLASQTKDGRNALRSFHKYKEIIHNASMKIQAMVDIIRKHKKERILIFTNGNKTAYDVSSKFLFPVISHDTKKNERKEILEKFRNGEWNILVSSRVLNEGIDVPQASVAIILSGSSTVREHVQRLGRILRKKGKRQAKLYEIICDNTTEIITSQKRRDHNAYKKIKPFSL